MAEDSRRVAGHARASYSYTIDLVLICLNQLLPYFGMESTPSVSRPSQIYFEH